MIRNPSKAENLQFDLRFAENVVNHYFDLYTRALAKRQQDKIKEYKKLWENAVDKRNKIQDKIDNLFENRLKSKNPRCRTFQVKRKVGKKTIQVRRKVCNPENKRTQLNKLLGTEVIVHDGGKNPIKGILRSRSKIFIVYDSVGRGVGFGSSEIQKIKGSNIYLENL